MLRTVIIDDEKNARTNILNIINTYCNNLIVVDTADSVMAGIKSIKEYKPDLVLLDIDMPDGTGFDILRELMPVKFMVIFITAYSEHAVTAIRFNALDFLQKPLDPEDFLLAINKAENNKAEKEQNLKLENLLDEINNPEKLRLALSTSESIYFVSPKQIVRIESDSNYSTFYLDDNRKVTVCKPLKEYNDLLVDKGFFRSHQSHLVNLNFVKEYKKKDGGCILLNNNELVPLSLRKKDKLLKAFNDYKG